MISDVEETSYLGASRTVVSATVSQHILYWDKSTGILLEAIQSFADFTLKLKAYKTNMWQGQFFGLEPFFIR